MKITFVTGAGVSKESGVPTYRDGDDALWYNYKVEEVSTEGVGQVAICRAHKKMPATKGVKTVLNKIQK